MSKVRQLHANEVADNFLGLPLMSVSLAISSLKSSACEGSHELGLSFNCGLPFRCRCGPSLCPDLADIQSHRDRHAMVQEVAVPGLRPR